MEWYFFPGVDEDGGQEGSGGEGEGEGEGEGDPVGIAKGGWREEEGDGENGDTSTEGRWLCVRDR